MSRNARPTPRNRSIPLPLLFQTRGSIWPEVKLPVIVFSIYASFIYLLDRSICSFDLGKTATLSGLISMIVGLMVSYRSGSSADRYHEGRRLWSSLTSTSRTFLRTLSLSLPPLGGQHDQAVIEVLQLIVALPYALKDHLRDQDPLKSEITRSFLPQTYLARPTLPTSDSARGPHFQGPEDNEAARTMKYLNDDTTAEIKMRAKPFSVGHGNVPLQIVRMLHVYLNAFHVTPLHSKSAPGGETVALDTPTWANSLQLLKELTEIITSCERIRDTPIPAALGIHLQQMLFLFMLAVPPQIVKTLGIWTVPATAITAFTYYGVDRTAEQLSDPFGFETNDLPLERYAADIQREYKELMIGESSTRQSSTAEDVSVTDTIDEKIKKEI